MTRPLWGIVGGMGARASAAFLDTVYARRIFAVEQDQPAVIVLSDPGMPDRTDALRNGRREALVRQLDAAFDRLAGAGAEHFVICCMTIHAVLEDVSPAHRQRVISLVDVLTDALRAQAGRHLMLCTEGTRQAQIFERHPAWAACRTHVCYPDAEDQRDVHRLVYDIKTHGAHERHHQAIDDLMRHYHADTVIAGCTELHLLVRSAHAGADEARVARWIDPLSIVADRIAAPVTLDRDLETCHEPAR
jgi:aspartate racemase